MIYDIENDWMIPAVGETFTIWDPRNNQTGKLKCVEIEHDQVCENCFYNQNKCKNSDFNGTILLCLAEQRPDNKNVAFVLTEMI